MGDRPATVLRRLAGQRDDPAHLLRGEGRRGAGAGGVGQPLRDARPGILQPTPPPRLDRRTTDVELVRCRPHAYTPTRQQNDPGANGKLLRASLLSDKRLQLLALSVSYGNRGSTKQGHSWNRHSFVKSLSYDVFFINGIRTSIKRY